MALEREHRGGGQGETTTAESTERAMSARMPSALRCLLLVEWVRELFPGLRA